MIGYYTGLRISETFALTWDDIDLESKTLTVNKQIVRRNNGADVRAEAARHAKKCQTSHWFFQEPKTKTSARELKFGQALHDALRAERKRQLENELKYGVYYTCYYKQPAKDEKGNDIIQIVPVPKGTPISLAPVHMICVDENGQYTSTDSFKHCAKVIHYELKLAFDYHSLRHTHATILIENGASVKSVQTRLGHTNIETTLQTYVHDTEKMADNAVQIFEDAAGQFPKADNKFVHG